MSLLDPWRQARAEIIASRPTYTPFYTPGDYAVTVGNPDTGMVDQVAPEVLPQVVQRQNEVMDDGRIDGPSLYDVHGRGIAVDPRPDQKFTGKTADNPYMQIDYRFANPAQPGLLYDPSQDLGPFASVGQPPAQAAPALQSAPVSFVEVSPQIDNLTPSDPMAAADDASYRSIDQTLDQMPLGSRGPAWDSLFDLWGEFNNPIDPITASEDYTRGTFNQAGLDLYRMGDEGLTPEQQQRVESGELAYDFYDPALQKQIDEFQTLQEQMDHANFERANEPLNASSRKVEDRALAHTLSLLNDRASVDPVAAAALQKEAAAADRSHLFPRLVSNAPVDSVVTRETPLNAFTTAELNQFNSPLTSTEVAAPTTMGIGYTPGSVTYDESGRAYAPALDEREEAPSLLESMGLLASKDTRGGGRFDVLGQDLLDPEITNARNVRDTASFLARGLPMGTLFSHMIGSSRAGDLTKTGGPYGRDSFGNYRFNALGPMGTLMEPLGELISPENYAYGGPMMNDYTGRFGLGTVGNTGISVTPSMYNADGSPKGGSFGYGIGFKADGTFGSLTASDVNDVQGMMDQGLIGTVGPGGSLDTSYAAAGEKTTAEELDAIDAGMGDDAGTESCVIATHGVKTGGFSERDKAVAEVWCQKKYHGKWWGELFRKGYQYLGNRAIERGKAEKYYGEFKAFIAYGRGLKPGLKHAINYYLRTAQFFATGAALTGVEQFQKLRKKINDLRNR